MSDKGAGPRRGSSMFSTPGAIGGPPPTNRPPQQMQGSGSTTPNGGPRRDSVLLHGMGGGGGAVGFGIDFDDSDYEDSDDEEVPHGGPHGGGLPGQAMPNNGPPSSQISGSANHRPLVGGFAAAAYEAARAHHYQNQHKVQQTRGHPQGRGQLPPQPNNRPPQKPY